MKVFSIYNRSELVALTNKKNYVYIYLYSRNLRDMKSIKIVKDEIKKNDYKISCLKLVEWKGFLVTEDERINISEGFYDYLVRSNVKNNNKQLKKYIRYYISSNDVQEIRDMELHLESIKNEKEK